MWTPFFSLSCFHYFPAHGASALALDLHPSDGPVDDTSVLLWEHLGSQGQDNASCRWVSGLVRTSRGLLWRKRGGS